MIEYLMMIIIKYLRVIIIYLVKIVNKLDYICL